MERVISSCLVITTTRKLIKLRIDPHYLIRLQIKVLEIEEEILLVLLSGLRVVTVLMDNLTITWKGTYLHSNVQMPTSMEIIKRLWILMEVMLILKISMILK